MQEAFVSREDRSARASYECPATTAEFPYLQLWDFLEFCVDFSHEKLGSYVGESSTTFSLPLRGSGKKRPVSGVGEGGTGATKAFEVAAGNKLVSSPGGAKGAAGTGAIGLIEGEAVRRFA